MNILRGTLPIYSIRYIRVVFAKGTQKVSFDKTFGTGNETREFKTSYSLFDGNVCFMISLLRRSKDRQTEQ